MQAQMRRSTLGDCPTCGRAHEPEKPLLDDVPNLELVPVNRRTWIAGRSERHVEDVRDRRDRYRCTPHGIEPAEKRGVPAPHRSYQKGA
jgi:hypothetical protein